jgi:hypothetical protein
VLPAVDATAGAGVSGTAGAAGAAGAAAGSGGGNWAPQFSQKAVPGKFSWPQVGQMMPPLAGALAGRFAGAAFDASAGGVSGAPH